MRLLGEMSRTGKSFWGWNDDEWMDIVERHRYDGNRIIAAAFLLCGFRKLDGFPKRRQVYSCLARRVFGFDRFENLISEAKNGLRGLGYRFRTLRTAPLTLAELLVHIRSPRIEDVTEAALRELQERTTDIAIEKTVFALSQWFALRGIIDEPVRRPKLHRTLLEEAPAALVENVPPEWARLARYWYDTSTLSPDCRLRHFYLSAWCWALASSVPSDD